MALSDKNIVITPNIGQTADPKIVFSGADGSTGANNITLTAYPTNSGTLSFDGSAGQLFSITNNLTGTLFSVNDISGIPSIEVIDTGLVRLTQYSGRVLLGTGTDNASDKLQVVGNIGATGSIAATNNIRAGTITVGTGATGATGSITASGTISATSGSITTGATGYVGATGSIGAPTGYFNNLFLNGTALSTSGGTAFATTSLQVTGTNGATGATGSITSTTLVVNPTGATGATGAILAIGTTAAKDLAGTGGGAYGSPELAIESTRIYTTASIINYSTTGGPTLSMGKSRSGTLGTVTATQSGDFLGGISFDGVNTTPQFANAANIVAEQDGAAGATWIPGRLEFQTSSGSAGAAERMRIDAAGGVNVANYLAVGTLTGATGATGALTVTGTTTLATSLNGILQATSGVVSTATIGSGLSFTGGTLSATGGGTTFATTSLQVTGTNGATGATGSISAGHMVIGASSATAGYKLDVVGNFKVSGSIDENVFAVVDGAGVALSPRNGTIQTWTLGASRTPTAGTWEAGESMTLMINDSASSFTVTWTSLPVTWVGGAAPTLAPASGFTIIQLWKVSTTIYGALVGQTA